MQFLMVIHLALTTAWITFFVFWFVMGFRANRTVKKESAGSRASYIVVGLIAYFLLLMALASGGFFGRRFLPDARPWPILGPILGIVLTYAGILTAIWARTILGKNWSSAVTIKKDHQLVRKGPYRVLRHPIYSGILLAVLGATFVKGEVKELLLVPALFLGFFVKSRKEERFMTEQFGEEYQEYQRKTAALIPFIL